MNVFALLGLAQRAGKLASGFDAVHRAVVRGRAKLILLSVDASANTAKRTQRIAEARRIPCIQWATQSELGQAIGRPDRAVVAILDEGLASAVSRALLRGE